MFKKLKRILFYFSVLVLFGGLLWKLLAIENIILTMLLMALVSGLGWVLFTAYVNHKAGSHQSGVPTKYIAVEKLHFARSMCKRLDEFREDVELIFNDAEHGAPLFKKHPHLVGHLATQDDFLMRLFYEAYGFYPDHKNDAEWQALMKQHDPKRCSPYIRPRLSVLGECWLPEYVEAEKEKA